jgi:hypothetical protein
MESGRKLNKAHRAVVAYLDGRRLKGLIYDFSAAKEIFHLYPEEDPLHVQAIEVRAVDLKAVFCKGFRWQAGISRASEWHISKARPEDRSCFQ